MNSKKTEKDTQNESYPLISGLSTVTADWIAVYIRISVGIMDNNGGLLSFELGNLHPASRTDHTLLIDKAAAMLAVLCSGSWNGYGLSRGILGSAALVAKLSTVI